MKAAIHKKYEPPEVVTVMEVEKQFSKDNEALIKVFANHSFKMNQISFNFY